MDYQARASCVGFLASNFFSSSFATLLFSFLFSIRILGFIQWDIPFRWFFGMVMAFRVRTTISLRHREFVTLSHLAHWIVWETQNDGNVMALEEFDCTGLATSLPLPLSASENTGGICLVVLLGTWVQYSGQ